jgi:hypothetical protein
MESQKVKITFPGYVLSYPGRLFMKLKKLKIFFFLTFLFINIMVNAREETSLYDEFTPEKISSFTCYLITNGEYYRAYTELQRLNSFYPSFLDKSVYDITTNYLFYKSKKYDELLQLDLSEPQKEFLIPLSLFRIDSLIKLDRKEEAETELLKLSDIENADNYSVYLKKRLLYLSILNNKKNDIKFSDDLVNYEELYLYSENVHQNKKQPVLGALAGIIPGMGYFYAGEKGTGIVSIIVMGTGSAVTYASYKNGMDALALITGVITFFFYGGSIAGGYMQTVKYNDRLMDTLELRLNRDLMPDKDIEEIYFKFGLNSNECK